MIAVLPGERVVARAGLVSGLGVGALTGTARNKPVVRVRRAVVLVLREAGFSYPRIGRLLGGRHHTTIMSAVAKAHALVEGDAGFRALVGDLRSVAMPLALGDAPGAVERGLRALASARSTEFDPRWCAQCDRRQTPAAARGCESPFCSLAGVVEPRARSNCNPVIGGVTPPSPACSGAGTLRAATSPSRVDGEDRLG